MSKLYAGAQIRRLRLTRKLTQAQMAREMDVSTSYFNQLENDQRPLTASLLLKLAIRFHVDASYFSPEHNAHLVTELRTQFPEVPSNQVIELAERAPELAEAVTLRLRNYDSTTPDPYREVQDFFFDSSNYIDRLDTAAESLSETLGTRPFRMSTFASVLNKDLGVTVRFGRHSKGPRRIFDPEYRNLNLRSDLTEAQQCFEVALQYALLTYPSVLEELSAPLHSEPAQNLAKIGLAQYFAAATTMPYSTFLETAEETRYDIEQIGARFGTSLESTCLRLTTLQRPGAQGIPFYFIRTDRAGNISKRLGAGGFHFSRTGGTCPLWVVHRAFETAQRFTRQVAAMPDGKTYLWIAHTVSHSPSNFGQPRRDLAIALGCDIEDAPSLIYSDGLNLDPRTAVPIGPSCAICDRTNCPQRAFPRSDQSINIDFNVTESWPSLMTHPVA